MRYTCSRLTGLILQLSHHFRSASGIPVQFTKTLFSGFRTPLLQIQKRQLPAGWDKDLPVFPADAKGLATRKAGEGVLQALGAKLPELAGGSADLEALARDKQLMAYRHEGFWQPMDTLRDKMHLEELWQSGKAPWKIW